VAARGSPPSTIRWLPSRKRFYTSTSFRREASDANLQAVAVRRQRGRCL
jgi:hypothetical protein